MRPILLSSVCSLLAAGPALASGAEFRDDRSSPQALVQSLYNAIERGEYERALSYFAERPVETAEEFAATFEDMDRISVVTGLSRQEGEGAERVHEVPLAVEIQGENWESRVLAGCYTVRAQFSADGSFQPYLIAGGALEATDAPLEEALPTRCGDGPALPPTDVMLQRASSLFEKSFGDICLRHDLIEVDEPEHFTIAFRRPFDEIDAPPHEARLFRFFCTRGAYNELHVYLLADDTGELLPVSFVVPELDIRYEDDRTMEEIRSIDVIGYTSRSELVNSHYDPDTLTMTAHSRWRGLGDASSTGKWIFRSGTFTLVRYEVDPTYDGEVNPVTVLDMLDGP
ncbi:MAG: DUF1176 domain-containing protein [Aliihoeflea sp.]